MGAPDVFHGAQPDVILSVAICSTTLNPHVILSVARPYRAESKDLLFPVQYHRPRCPTFAEVSKRGIPPICLEGARLQPCRQRQPGIRALAPECHWRVRPTNSSTRQAGPPARSPPQPEGRHLTSPGRKPWERSRQIPSPAGAAPTHILSLRLFGVRTCPLCNSLLNGLDLRRCEMCFYCIEN